MASPNDKDGRISWDWSKTTHLNPVKDQGKANCCYAFAFCDLIAAFFHITNPTEPHIELSPQDIYSQVVKSKRQDAKGISIHEAATWIIEHGCVYETDCPYVGKFNHPVPTGNDRTMRVKIDLTTWVYLENDFDYNLKGDKREEKKLQNAIKLAPVVGKMLWIDEMNFLTGDDIYCGPEDATAYQKKKDPNDDDDDDDDVDSDDDDIDDDEEEEEEEEEEKEEDDKYHAVLIVGYGEEMRDNNLIKYWIVRNSHGPEWGNKGYAKITRARCHGKLLIDCALVLKEITKAN